MMTCWRTAGCPSVERNVLTVPTGGASSVLVPAGADSPVAQPRHRGRADDLKRRRKVRDEILGRAGKPSQSPSRQGRRQTLYSCLVQPAGVDASFPNESLAPVSRASSATSWQIKLDQSVPSGVRPLDFRDHIAVRPCTPLVFRRWHARRACRLTSGADRDALVLLPRCRSAA